MNRTGDLRVILSDHKTHSSFDSAWAGSRAGGRWVGRKTVVDEFEGGAGNELGRTWSPDKPFA